MNDATPSGGDMTGAFASALSSASTPAAEASPASTPTTEPTAAETSPAAAIAQPAATEQTPVSASVQPEDKKGEPPAWRWQDILENARKTSAQEAEARLRQEYQWTQQIQPHERDGLLVVRAALAGDPQAVQLIRTNPQAFAALRGLVAEQQQQAAATAPEPDLQTADGTLVYSAPQLQKWQEWNARQMREQFTQEFKPLTDTVKEIEAQKHSERVEQQRHQWAAGVLAPIQRMPYFQEFKTDIGKAVMAAANSTEPLHEVVWDAYAKLHQAKLDSQAKSSEATTLANLQQRAVAGTVNPNGANATTPRSFQQGQQGFADALAHFGAGR